VPCGPAHSLDRQHGGNSAVLVLNGFNDTLKIICGQWGSFGTRSSQPHPLYRAIFCWHTTAFFVMIWGAFWGSGRSDVYLLEREWESKKHGYSVASYIQVLDDNLIGTISLAYFSCRTTHPVIQLREQKPDLN